MANYTKTTDFAAKDTLAGGDTNKVIRGAEFETEFDAIATAVATKSDTAGPTFTGTVTIPTADINGGNIDGTVIGASSAAAGTFTNLVVTSADINGGTVDGATIGGSSAGAGTFTNLTASGTVNFSGATISNLGTITTANLDGGTVDNAVIGGATPAAGSFTTLSASSTFTVNGGVVTATAAELNILDGVTSTAAELNILDGKSFVDEDDLSSNSATGIPSQQSVKAYVDSQTGLGGATLAGLADTTVTSPADAALLFYDTGTSKWIDNVVSGDVTIADTGVAAIGSGVIVNADVNASAAIDVSKTALVAGTGITLSTNTLNVDAAQTQITSVGTLGSLDVDNIQIDANAVKSTNTDGNIQLFPNGEGFTELYGNTNAGAIRFNCESNSHGVTLKGPPHSATATYSLELPNADGTAGQVLQTNGSGKLSFGDTAGGATLEATASGALANGDTVIVNANGTVSVVAQTAGDPSAGTPVVYESGGTYYSSVAYDANAQKIVIAYKDGGNSNYGTAVVGTVSGTSISFGTPAVFESARSDYTTVVYDSNAQKVVIVYSDQGNTYAGTAVVGTVSGTSISFGSPAVFESTYVFQLTAAFDANANKVVIAFRDGGNSDHGTAIVGTVSGTSISFGSATVFEAAGVSYMGSAYDANAQKVVITYADEGNSSHGTAIVGTISGTSISFGSAAVFESATIVYTSAAYDSNAQKVVIAYRDEGNSSYGTAIVGTVSGTSISFGTAAVFESATSSYVSAVYDAGAQKVVIAYQDGGNSNYGTAVVGTVSGTSISFGTPLVFESATVQYVGIGYDANAQRVVIAYLDSGNSSYGTATVFASAPLVTNLTAENYIGISDAAYADGATATVQIVGSVDDAQSSLTPGQQYFVQLDGSLGTTAADPSVFAGTAVAATKIIVKG